MIIEIDDFDWDTGNFSKNLKKHGILSGEIEEVFLNNSVFVFPDPGHSHEETRFIGFGKTNSGKWLAIAFTMRAKAGRILLRPISGRPMHKKEKEIYEKEFSI